MSPTYTHKPPITPSTSASSGSGSSSLRTAYSVIGTGGTRTTPGVQDGTGTRHIRDSRSRTKLTQGVTVRGRSRVGGSRGKGTTTRAPTATEVPTMLAPTRRGRTGSDGTLRATPTFPSKRQCSQITRCLSLGYCSLRWWGAWRR